MDMGIPSTIVDPIPNSKLKLEGPIQYWGGGPPGKFVVLYLLFCTEEKRSPKERSTPKRHERHKCLEKELTIRAQDLDIKTVWSNDA